MGTSYPATVIFPKDGLMTLVSHGPMGVERDFAGNDPVWRGVGTWLPTASFPAIDYCIPYDAELIAREIKKAGYRNVGIVGWNNMLFGFGDTLRKLLDGVTLSDATRLVDPLKAKKSAEEIELIRMAGQMQDEILAKVQGQIKAGKKDFELLAYGGYVGNLLGSETGYMLGSSAPPGQPTQIRGRREQGRAMRDGDVIYYQCENTGPGRHDDPCRPLLRARQGAAGTGRRLRHHLRGAGQHRADAAARRVMPGDFRRAQRLHAEAWHAQGAAAALPRPGL